MEFNIVCLIILQALSKRKTKSTLTPFITEYFNSWCDLTKNKTFYLFSETCPNRMQKKTMIYAHDFIIELSAFLLKTRILQFLQTYSTEPVLNTNPERPLIAHKIACKNIGLCHLVNK